MKLLKLSLILLFLTINALGQKADLDFMGEGNGNMVKLKWVPYAWPQNLEGVFIKRRSVKSGITSNWISLHDDLIYPAISKDKDYKNVEKNASEQQRLSDKLRKMLAEGSTKEILQKDFNEKVFNNEEILKNLRVGFLVDYDLTLLQGFGFIDRDISASDSYEYGLFPKYINQPLEPGPISTFLWKYGTKPDLTLHVESKIKRIGKKNQIEINWSVKTDELSNKKIAGFNIYKKLDNQVYEKINKNVIFMSLTNKTEHLIYRDQIENDSILTYFAASPVSGFGTSGPRYEIRYELAKMEVYITSAKLIPALDSIPKELTFNWEFDKQNEKYIDGFLVERKSNMNEKFVPVSGIIPATSRTFTDKSLPRKGYYYYHLVVVKKNKAKVEGETISAFYRFVQPPPVPKNFKGTYVSIADQDYIDLTWSKRIPEDTLTKQYHLYLGTPSENQLFDDNTIPKISKNSYRHKIGLYQRGKWKFALTSLSTNGVESKRTDTLVVFAPSKVVPMVNNNVMELKNNRASISWNYASEDVPDLAGFQIFQDGVLVAGESTLKSETRMWTSGNLDKGKKYKFEIMAVTRFNVSSKKSEGQIIVK